MPAWPRSGQVGDGNKAFVSLRFKQPQRLSHLAFRSREMTDGSSIIQSIRLILNEGEQVLGPFLSPDPAKIICLL